MSDAGAHGTDGGRPAAAGPRSPRPPAAARRQRVAPDHIRRLGGAWGFEILAICIWIFWAKVWYFSLVSSFKLLSLSFVRITCNCFVMFSRSSFLLAFAGAAGAPGALDAAAALEKPVVPEPAAGGRGAAAGDAA